MGDIGIFLDQGFLFDVRIKDGDLESDEGLETAVTISLFTDKRVTDEELPALQESKRGWWGDMFPDVDRDQIGSKLWTLERSKRILETLRLAEDYIREALKWMIEDGIASSVKVTAEFLEGETSGKWAALVEITKPSGRQSKFQVLWDKQKIIRG